jgi:hypothetical protein
MSLSLDNDKYLQPPTAETVDFTVEVTVSVVYSHTLTVEAEDEDHARAMVDEMEKQIMKDAISKNEIADFEFQVDYISDPRD